MNDCVASMAEALLKKNSRATMKLTEKVYVCILPMLHIYKGDTDVHFLLYLKRLPTVSMSSSPLVYSLSRECEND